jgi:uncharacterized hydrophobic protein (TIGR00271 family)
MIHVRVVSPPDLTELLLPALTMDAGVRNLVVLTGAAQRPAGDAIQFDVRTTSANTVLRQLRDLGLGHRGVVTVANVDATIGDLPVSGAIGGFRREAAPIWEMVEARIRAEGVYPPSFFGLLVIAGLIGAVGILTNSQILVVGAMVVGPEYSAIIAVALGIDKRDRSAIRDGLLALLAGFLAAVFVTFLFGLVIHGLGRAPAAFVLGVRPVSDLINTPNLFSVIVAVLAGIVGVVSLTEARAGALIGVFISVTTIPAAADMGISIAFESWHEAWGSLLQLLLNIVILVAVGAGALRVQRVIWRPRSG